MKSSRREFLKGSLLSSGFCFQQFPDTLHPQTMFIKNRNGSQSAHELEEVRKLTFEPEEMTVTSKDNNEDVYCLDEIQNINFFDSEAIGNSELISSLMADYSGGSSGSLKIVLQPDKHGVSVITVIVEDELGAQTKKSFKLIVNPVNDAPVVVNPTGNQSVHASFKLEIPVSPILGEIFDGADRDELEISVTTGDGGALPEWAKYADNKLILTPMIADTGCVVIAITATDPSGASATDRFELRVKGYPVSADYLNAGNISVNLFPNPARDEVNLEVKRNANRPVSFSVYNLTGKLVLRKGFSADELIRFNMVSQVSGIYFVKVHSGENEEVKILLLKREIDNIEQINYSN